jgi:hypothetical protein
MIFVHQASADHPSLVQPHSLNALSAIVNLFTGGTQIRHFVMAITSVRVGSAVGEAAGSSRLPRLHSHSASGSFWAAM